MKKSMPAYITELSGNDFEVLENIFLYKYQKFIQLYWMISNYNDNITQMQYNQSDNDELHIEFKVSQIKPNKVVQELESELDDSDGISIWISKKVIHISITDSNNEEDTESLE